MIQDLDHGWARLMATVQGFLELHLPASILRFCLSAETFSHITVNSQPIPF